MLAAYLEVTPQHSSKKENKTAAKAKCHETRLVFKVSIVIRAFQLVIINTHMLTHHLNKYITRSSHDHYSRILSESISQRCTDINPREKDHF
jgi:hypothetical protein